MTQRTKILILLAALLVAGGILAYVLPRQQEITINPPSPSPAPPPASQGTAPPTTTTPMTPTPTPNPSPQPQPTPPPPTPVTVPAEISRGNTAKKQVIFTFDGGAGIQSAQKILDVLAKHQVKGTFFVTGKWAEQNPDLMKAIANTGHEIFNHTYSHADLTTISDAQIRSEFSKAENIISGLTGKTTKPYFRPPYGARNLHVRQIAAQEGYTSVYWTLDALDWQETATAEGTKQRILSNVSNGAIYLMHIGDNITGDILDEVFTEIKNRGFGIVSLTQGM